MNTGKQPYSSKQGLYPLVGWKIGKEVVFVIEGTDRNAGSVVEWAKDLGLIQPDELANCAKIASSVRDTNGVIVVPGFSGLNHPYHDDTARGAILGIKRETKREHIVRAIFEGICCRIKDLVDCVGQDIPIAMRSPLRADGGVTQNTFIMQFGADMLQTNIDRANQSEMSSQGVAFFAGLRVGMWENKEALKKVRQAQTSHVFKPNKDDTSPSEQERILKYAQWKKAVGRSMHWEDSNYDGSITSNSKSTEETQ